MGALSVGVFLPPRVLLWVVAGLGEGAAGCPVGEDRTWYRPLRLECDQDCADGGGSGEWKAGGAR